MRSSYGLAHIKFLVLAVCLAVSGCRSASDSDVPTIWRTELRSPDGVWIATAHTEQNGGFGSAMILTNVDLKRVDGAIHQGKPINILQFDCVGPAPHAYVLDQANAGGTIDLKLKWVDPSHLQATYNGNAKLVFQVAKLDDVNISVVALTPATPALPQ